MKDIIHSFGVILLICCAWLIFIGLAVVGIAIIDYYTASTEQMLVVIFLLSCLGAVVGGMIANI